METKDYLAYVVNQIHTTIVATVDDEGLPVTAAIDMMDNDDDSLYFLTAKVPQHLCSLWRFALIGILLLDYSCCQSKMPMTASEMSMMSK